MAEKFLFYSEHSLSKERAKKALVELLDIFDRGGDFDIIELSSDGDSGFIENEDMKVTFSVEDNKIEVELELYFSGLNPDEIRELLERDIGKAFRSDIILEEVHRESNRRSRGLPHRKKSSRVEEEFQRTNFEEDKKSEGETKFSESKKNEEKKESSSNIIWLVILLALIGAGAWFYFYGF